nr:amino acid adenylation domain-containing protein [Polyangiaceae bacterium]
MNATPTEGYGLSPAQRRAWRLGASPGPSARAQIAVELGTPADAERVRASARRFVDAHEICRTCYPAVPGLTLPLQVVAPGERADVVAPGVRPAPSLSEAMRALRLAPLDFERGPLWRFDLVDAAGRLAIVATAPALSADRATLRLFAEHVRRELSGGPLGPPGESMQYPDVAAWLNDVATSAEAEPGRHYWERLARASAGSPLALSVEAGSPEGAAERVSLSFSLEAGAVEELARLAARGVDGEAALLACWAIVLRRAAGRWPRLGVADTGRAHAELLGTAGPLARFLPFALDVGDGATVADLLTQTAASLSEGRRWGSAYDGADEGTFSALFEYVTSTADAPAADEWYDGEPAALKLTCFAEPSTLRGALEYDPAAVPTEAARRLLWQLRALAEGLEGALDRPPAGLTLMLPEERSALLAQARGEDTGGDDDRPLHRRVIEQAAATPGAIAVLHEGPPLRYAELVERATAIARHVRRLGRGPGSLVGVFLERSLEQVAAALGVMMSGAAYVPIDPANPDARVAAVAAELDGALVLTSAALAGRLPAGVEALRLDALGLADGANETSLPQPGARGSADGANEAGSPLPETSPHAPAYVIYTSGSTGTPKGVLVSHDAIGNRIAWGQREYPLTPADRVLQSAPIGFDFSIWELFAPLCAGAALVLARPGAEHDPDHLFERIEGAQATVAHFVPSLLAVLLAAPRFAERCASLRLVFCGGEALRPETVAAFYAQHGATLYNQYGPTEATVDATFWRCPPAPLRTVPIGRPIANASAYILNDRRELVPTWATGELYLGGRCVALGYHRRPPLTAERFLPDPFGGAGPLYRSGDLARYLPDGTIEFLGRCDEQVNLRGARVELGEIEAALAGHPKLRHAAVVVRASQPGDERLVAYVLADDPRDADPDALRAFLRRSLPEYMLPSAFVSLSDWPRTVTGKLDRSALPDSAPALLAERRPPRDALEAQLAACFQAVLRLEAPPGID